MAVKQKRLLHKTKMKEEDTENNARKPENKGISEQRTARSGD